MSSNSGNNDAYGFFGIIIRLQRMMFLITILTKWRLRRLRRQSRFLPKARRGFPKG
jgi:hypothetical protein